MGGTPRSPIASSGRADGGIVDATPPCVGALPSPPHLLPRLMIHPLLKILIQRPDLVITHIANYGDLVQDEARGAMRHLVRTLIGWIAAVIALSLFLVFTGVALMIGLVQQQFHWVLLAVPGAMLLIALVAMSMARRPILRPEIGEIKQQLLTDLHMLRSAGESHE